MAGNSNPTGNEIVELVNGIVRQKVIYPKNRFDSMEATAGKIQQTSLDFTMKGPAMSEVHAVQAGMQKR